MDRSTHVARHTHTQCNLEVADHRLLLVSGNTGRVKQIGNKAPNILEENERERDIVRIAGNNTND